VADSGTDSGTDIVLDDADTTREGLGQEFSATAAGEILTGCTFSLKVGAGAPTGPIYAEIYDSDDAGPSAPTGALLARSEDVLPST